MPSKRRRTSSRRSSGPVAPTANILSRVPRPISQVHKIRRTCNYSSIPYNGLLGWLSAGRNLQIHFSCSVVTINVNGVGVYNVSYPNNSEFSALYDQYRIAKVTVRLDWNTNSLDYTQVTQSPPLLYTVIDYDDSNDADLNALLQYPGVSCHSFQTNGYKPYIVSFSPKVLSDVNGSSGSTVQRPMRAPFIKTSVLSVPHYGLKLSVGDQGANANIVIGNLTVTVYCDFEFTNPK